MSETVISSEKLAKIQQLNQQLEKAKVEFSQMQSAVRIKELEAIAIQNLLSSETLRLYVEYHLNLEDTFDILSGVITRKEEVQTEPV
jgi:hypothetical protein